jgi:transcriptional regulator with XRE-family HTH domain
MRVREAAALRRRRERLGLTQRELAFLARPCSQTTIYLLETRRMTTLTEGLAQRIARRLDVPLEDLFEDRTSLGAPRSATGQRVTGSSG